MKFKNIIFFTTISSIILTTIPANASSYNTEALVEQNARDIVLIKKTLVKLIKERELLLRKCQVSDKKYKTLQNKMKKEDGRARQKLHTVKKTKSNKALATISENKKTRKSSSNVTSGERKFKANVFKRIYAKPDFDSKKIGKIEKGEIFSTKDDVTRKNWIYVNNTGYIHINIKRKKGVKK